MNTKEIGLIAMDMDGTLLNDKKEISPANREALARASAKGIAIAICSGRSSGDNSIFASRAGLGECHILSCNGAYCLDKPHGKPYANHTMDREAAKACLAVLGEYDINYACFAPDEISVMESDDWPGESTWAVHRNQPGAPVLRQGLAPVWARDGEGLHKIVYVERHNAKRLEEIRARLLPIRGMDLTRSGTDNLELMPSGVNKGTAVKELAERLGLAPDNVMVFGDFENDLPMFRYAGYGVAMGNASQAVKRAARYHTDTNLQDGVARAIWQYAL